MRKAAVVADAEAASAVVEVFVGVAVVGLAPEVLAADLGAVGLEDSAAVASAAAWAAVRDLDPVGRAPSANRAAPFMFYPVGSRSPARRFNLKLPK